MQFAAVIFDMDGLMLDTERLAREAWLGAAAELGHSLDDTGYARLIGLNRKDSMPVIRELVGEAGDVDAFNDLAWAKYRELVNDPIPCKPGLRELLDWLDARGIPCGVATSTGAQLARHKLEQCGLHGRFKAFATGNEVANGKPDPEIYHLCASRLGVEARDCLVLEDSMAGVTGAHAAGASVVMIPDLVQPTDAIRAKATAVLESLAEVPAWIEARGRHR